MLPTCSYNRGTPLYIPIIQSPRASAKEPIILMFRFNTPKVGIIVLLKTTCIDLISRRQYKHTLGAKYQTWKSSPRSASHPVSHGNLTYFTKIEHVSRKLNMFIAIISSARPPKQIGITLLRFDGSNTWNDCKWNLDCRQSWQPLTLRARCCSNTTGGVTVFVYAAPTVLSAVESIDAVGNACKWPSPVFSGGSTFEVRIGADRVGAKHPRLNDMICILIHTVWQIWQQPFSTIVHLMFQGPFTDCSCF